MPKFNPQRFGEVGADSKEEDGQNDEEDFDKGKKEEYKMMKTV